MSAPAEPTKTNGAGLHGAKVVKVGPPSEPERLSREEAMELELVMSKRAGAALARQNAELQRENAEHFARDVEAYAAEVHARVCEAHSIHPPVPFEVRDGVIFVAGAPHLKRAKAG